MASSKYHREARNRLLMKVFENMAYAKIHFGASETKDFQLDFKKTFNSKKQKDEYGKRTKVGVARLGEKKLETAKKDFRLACKNCELVDRCCNRKAGNLKATKEARERMFFRIYDTPAVRKRFRNRIKQEDFRSGIVTAFCDTLCRPGRLTPSTDYIK